MKLTIITINYNNAAGLQKTMESVLSQTSQDFEYIVVDGDAPQTAPQPPKGGVLRDLEVIEGFIKEKAKKVNGFTACSWLSPFGGVGGGFYSEPDTGIYNAMNKGIAMAKGEYIHILNSGDWLVDSKVVENMLFALSSPPLGKLEGVDIFVGNKIMVRPDGKVRYGKNDKRPVTAMTFYRGTIEHTSAYIRRSLFDINGFYDESLRIVSDWKWYFQVVMLHNAQVAFTDIYVSYFDNTGISSTNLELDKAERRQILEQILPSVVLADYDRHHLAIDQNERLQRYPLIYKFFYLVERILFKFDKWNGKYWSWKKS
jgi:glycosyltransferase involved in cell wall biosynthesis